jgi:uncharacterized protein (TIGR03790 family)
MANLRWLAVPLLLAAAAPAGALGPAEVFVVVNRNVPASQEVADHYCLRRGVPRENVIVLDLPADEDISRQDYNHRMVMPLRAALADRRDRVKVLLTVYGVPLRVGPHEPDSPERAQLVRVLADIDELQVRSRKLDDLIASLERRARDDAQDMFARTNQKLRAERNEVAADLKPLERRRRQLSYAESEASVDSELMLLWWGHYDLRRWQMNPLYFQVPDAVRRGKPPVLMVSRLDGPSPALVKRLVDQSLAVERRGLAGKVYVDARGIVFNPSEDTGHGYGGYDESLREMARLLGREAGLPVTLDDNPELFAPGSCPECALYCGWYSLAHYVPCCKFVPGAVGYHIASAEAVSLRNPRAKYWCKNLLEDGVVATLGPVAEPYTLGFPKPAEFFGFLVTGDYPLVECYSRTMLLTSWMTVLVGDPLYNPFARNPRLRPDQVRPSPAGVPFRLLSRP